MCGRFAGLVAAAGLLLGLSPAGASPTEPASGWITSYFDELRLLSPGRPYFVMTGPCERLDLARWVADQPSGSGQAASRRAWLAEMLRRELGPELALEGSGGPVWILDSNLGGGLERDRKGAAQYLLRSWLYLPQGVSLWTTLRTTVNGADYHRVETRPWRDRWRASMDYGGIGYRKGGLSVFAGRDEVSWGASRDLGLMFSGAGPTLDMLRLSLRTGHLLFTSVHSELRASPADPWDAGVRRFIAAHRLEVLAGTRWDFSVSEVVVYGGEGRGFDPGYLNPLAPFYEEQWNSYRNDNMLLGADLMYRLPERAEIKGELLVDDFQIDPGSEPNKVGFGLAIDAVNPLAGERSLVGCSYFRVARGTYGHAVPWNRYIEEGKVMGFPGGPDGDRFEAWSSWSPQNPIVLKADYTLVRQGEGRATDPQSGKAPRTPFPSGTVDTTHNLSAEMAWRPSYPLQLRLLAQWSSERNVANVDGLKASGFKASISISYSPRIWVRES